MLRTIYILVALFLLTFQVACSSNNVGDDDLDISEIKEIESTGEFSEDEFFSDDELVAEGDGEEGKLIDVPGEEVAIEEGADLEEVGDDLDLEILEEGEADLLADADLNVENEFEEGSDEGLEGELAEDDGDLNLDELEIENDVIDDTELADNSGGGSDDLLLEEDGTDFSDFDDFEDTASVDPGPSLEGESVNIDSSEIDDLVAGDIGGDEPSASELLQNENVTIENELGDDFDSGNSTDLAEDNTGFDDFNDSSSDVNGSEQASAATLLDGEDISIDSSYEDVSANTSSSSTSGYSTGGYSSDSSTETASLESEPVKKKTIPVKKMKTVPYVKNGILANSIYFVRSGDSLESIANKIYGSGSAVDFTIVNPHLRPGALRVGQKVYYNSPRRPQDRSRLITFYEDMGSPAQYYQASQGDNIRKISKDLLGHSRSWMEIWASNQDIVSKGILDNNYSVRYWMGNDVSRPTVFASNKPVNETPAVAPTPVKRPTIKKDPVVNNTASNNNRNSLDAEIEIDQRIEDDRAQQQIADNNSRELEDFDEPSPDENLAEPDFDEPEPEIIANNDDPFNGNNNRPSAAGRVQNDPPSPTNNNEPDFSNDDLAGTETSDFDNSPETLNNNNPETPRQIAKRPSFPVLKRNGPLSKSMIETIAMGVGGLLLLLAIILIVRKKRKRAEAIQMDTFDFGGETTIENEQTKTQIDI